VLGYYTLASSAIVVGGLPKELAKKLPKHPVPVVLLARLALDRSMNGRGMGAFLLRDALTRSLDLTEDLGIHAVVVDALDSAAKAFYKRFGFLALTDTEMRFFLPIGTIMSAAKP
jgi:predicted N-acetyltransferase YhbS